MVTLRFKAHPNILFLSAASGSALSLLEVALCPCASPPAGSLGKPQEGQRLRSRGSGDCRAWEVTRPCVNLKGHPRRPSCPHEAVLAHPERPAPPQGQLPNIKIEQGLQAAQEQHTLRQGWGRVVGILQRGQRALRQKGQVRPSG